jgi:type II restriction/modification system DNA methylase subunit YeeA
LPYADDNFYNGEKLGEINFEYGNLIVCSFQVKQSLSERSGKKAQYELGKKILKTLEYDAGIFIFYDEQGNFRFSLIYANYLGRRRDWSSFRRFTYFVSKDFTNKTFLQRIGDGDFSSIAKIKEAFSVEKVTKEFYLQYRQFFEELVTILSKNYAFLNEASRNQIDVENFSKKLLGQIVFLYFLQKKGWLGVPQEKNWGSGDKNFLTHIFEDAEKQGKNFYNDYLEPLFYDTLNNPRRDSADPSFSPYFKSRIPFLNGGLFEGEYDWKNSLIYLDNKIFGKIFEVFDRYNFTVEEESPDDKEVAVDPEMLGKVFENLLPENLRKGKGTYYTPREIVHYMCRESLINYLSSNHSSLTEEKIRQYIYYADALDKDIAELQKVWGAESFIPGQWKELDNLLKNIKVCDPACGSGAFLVGMLNEIVKLRMFLQLTPDSELFSNKEDAIKQLSEYQIKKETIENCLYGVDIDSGAIEIAKLRLWLSLVVDYSLEHVDPLPNLDYRLMTGNSLIEEFKGIKFYNGDDKNLQNSLLPFDNDYRRKTKELELKIKEYFDLHDDEAKKKKRSEINVLKDWFIRSSLEARKKQIQAELEKERQKANMLNEKNRREYLAMWSDKFLSKVEFEEILKNLHNPKKERPFFIWKLEFIDVFAEKGGFDIVIANPPYIQLQKALDNKRKYADLYKDAGYETFDRKGDIYCLFYECGMKLLKEGGILTYISSNKWMRAGYGEKLRAFFLKYNPLLLVDLGPNVFESATVDTNILILQKAPNANNLHAVTIYENKKDNFDLHEYIKTNVVILKNLTKNAWFIGTEAEQKLKEKIEKIGKPLKEWDAKIYYGIKTGLNEAFIITTEKRNEILANCKTEEERKRTEAIIKPILRGRDIKRYYYEWAGLWVIVIPAGWTNENRGNNNPEKFIMEQFSSLMVHLKKYEKEAKKREDKGDYWWELRHCAYYPEFEKEKVVYSEIVRQPQFYYDTEKFYIEATSFLMTGESVKYICGLLNSKSTSFFFKKWYAGGGLGEEGYRYKKEFLENLLLPPITSSNKPIIQQIEALVDKIIFAKKQNKNADTSAYEKQIDQLVYKLYSLTEEEIKIIEENENN